SGVLVRTMHEVLDFALPIAQGTLPAERAPVRVFVSGVNQWRDLDTSPPEGAPQTRLHLGSGGTLSEAAAVQPSDPTRYTYDPADPTPAVGGPRLLPGT